MEEQHQSPGPAGDEAEIIVQPSPLRDKVSLLRDGEADPVALAEKEVEEQGKTYLDRARDELLELRDAFASGMADAACRPDALRRMFTVAHDMKGQGKSFGYDMITSIGSSLSELLRDRTEMEDSGMKVVKLHIDALGVVFDHDLKGEGGEQGRLLLARLSGLVSARDG